MTTCLPRSHPFTSIINFLIYRAALPYTARQGETLELRLRAIGRHDACIVPEGKSLKQLINHFRDACTVPHFACAIGGRAPSNVGHEKWESARSGVI